MSTDKRTVLVTGGTGNMGRVTVARLLRRSDTRIKVLIREQERRHPQVKTWLKRGEIEIVWGDLTDFPSVLRAVAGVDVVLHLGGLVSPLADELPPELVAAVNVGGTDNLVKAIRQRQDAASVRLIYIGTVAETGDRNPPIHWGRTGDPIKISRFDHYAVTKTRAEAIVAESGLRYWVSLRQTGIAHYDLWRTSGPILFHNPVNGVFEWTTAHDSARLMDAVSGSDVPDALWRNFYNIGGGAGSRVINHEFMTKSMHAMGIRDFRKILDPRWMATRNFHGQWYADSDELEALVPFREQSLGDFFREVPKHVPAIVRIVASFFPAAIRAQIRKSAEAPGGPLYWLRENDDAHINAYFGSRAEWEKIPASWDDFTFAKPSQEPALLNHGYDRNAPKQDWTLADLHAAAEFRGGACHAQALVDPYTPLGWECARGHRFEMSPNLHLAGGHWCPECQVDPDCYEEVARASPYFAQAW